MKALKCLVLVFAAALFSGCAHTLTFTSFETGEVLKGRATAVSRTIRVAMTDGEIVEGKYSAVDSSSVGFSFGSATAFSGAATATAFGSGTSYMLGGPGSAFALLKGTKPGSKLMMEMMVSYSAMTGHGFGEARTNDGRKYRVQF